MSKTQKIEYLLGGSAPHSLSPDALNGVNDLAHRLADTSEEDALFEIAVKRASDEELRKLARFRLEAEQSKYLD